MRFATDFLRTFYPEENFEHAQNFSPGLPNVPESVTVTPSNLGVSYEFCGCVPGANRNSFASQTGVV